MYYNNHKSFEFALYIPLYMANHCDISVCVCVCVHVSLKCCIQILVHVIIIT